MYEPSYKSRIVLTSVILIFGIAGMFTSGDLSIPLFVIIMSLASFVVIITDYRQELKDKKYKGLRLVPDLKDKEK